MGFTAQLSSSSPLTAELWAIYFGLKLGWDRGFRKVQIESDSIGAIQKISSAPTGSDLDASLITSIRELLYRDWDCHLSHVFREANHCADWLAHHHNSLDVGLLTIYDPPTGLLPLLFADALGVACPRVL